MSSNFKEQCRIEFRNGTLIFYCENCPLYSDNKLTRECLSRQLQSLYLKLGLDFDMENIKHIVMVKGRRRRLPGVFSVRVFKALYEIYACKLRVKSLDLRHFIHDPLNTTLVNLAKKDGHVLKILKKYDLLDDFISMLSANIVFTEKVYSIFSQENVEGPSSEGYRKLVEEYEVFPYTVKIVECRSETFYEVSITSSVENLLPLIELICDQVRGLVSDSFIRRSFNDFIDESVATVKRLLMKNTLDTLDDYAIDRIALLTVFRCLRLDPILSLLLDDNVDEFFINSPMDRIVVEHVKYGRCLSNIVACSDLVNVLKLKCIIDSRKDLTEVNPSTRAEFFSRFFSARVTIDIPPLAVNGPYVIFRKIKESLLPIYKLIDLNTLDAKMCALLILSLYTKRNMAIVGEPKAGKTTLMNALRMLTPNWWRKIVIEETIESLGYLYDGSLLYKLYGGYTFSGEKLSESVKVLHRSPDIVFLGEVYTEEHSKAFFQLLSSGVQCVCTFHARTPQSAISKWINHHRVPEEELANLDLLVHISNVSLGNKPMRRIISIGEISHSEKLSYKPIFAYIPSYDAFKQVVDIRNTRLAKKIHGQYGLPLSDLASILDRIEKIIQARPSPEVFCKHILSILNEQRSHG